MIEDRRASLRIAAKPGSYILYVEGLGAIRDLSLDGVFVLDPSPLPAGTSVLFSLCFGAQDLALQGIVRRSVPQEGMGIQFTEMSPETKTQLRSYLAAFMIR